MISLFNKNIMTELQKEFEATGYASWVNSDLYPDTQIYTKEYTRWLEAKVINNKIKNMITEFKDYSDLPFSKTIQDELFKRHTHAELVQNQETIVYEEKDVLILMQMLKAELRLSDVDRSLFIELATRANLVFPITEQELGWFDEGTDFKKSGDFIPRLLSEVDRIQNDV